MSKRVQIRLPFDQDLESHLKVEIKGLRDFRIISRSLDARGASRGKKPIFIYQVDILTGAEVFDSSMEELSRKSDPQQTPLIIGAGRPVFFVR